MLKHLVEKKPVVIMSIDNLIHPHTQLLKTYECSFHISLLCAWNPNIVEAKHNDAYNLKIIKILCELIWSKWWAMAFQELKTMKHKFLNYLFIINP